MQQIDFEHGDAPFLFEEDESRKKRRSLGRFFTYAIAGLAFALLCGYAEEEKKKKEFKKKYRTVVKENIFGLRSYEYHER